MVNLIRSRTAKAVLATAATVGVSAPAVLSSCAPASAAVVSTVTRYATAVTSVRSAPSISAARVGTVPAGTKITGALSNGWVKIASPAQYAGRYISNSVLSPSAPSAPASSMTAWAGYARTQLLNSAGSVIGSVPADTKLVGKLSGSYFAITSGPYVGKKVSKYDVMWTDPAFALTGEQSAPSSKAAVGQVVKRYLVSGLDYGPALRSAPSTHSTLLKRLAPGSSFTGQYVNGAWFKITSGADAGRYINADLLHSTPTMSAVNGRIPSSDLCKVPSWMNTNWSPNTPRTLQCNALAGLLEMNKAFKARFGYDLDLDEGYRDRRTQDMYYRVYGYPSAAMPGTSNHGYGRAIDLLGTRAAMLDGKANPYRFGTAADAWLTANGKKYGWDRPDQFDRGGANPEFWHYNWIG